MYHIAGILTVIKFGVYVLSECISLILMGYNLMDTLTVQTTANFKKHGLHLQ